MATGTQVPWTTPGGTPCCCEVTDCNYISGPNTAWQPCELTAAQFAVLYAGGTVTISEFVATFNVSATLGCNRQSLQATATYPQTVLTSSQSNGCQQEFSQTVGLSTLTGSLTSTIVLTPCNRIPDTTSINGSSSFVSFSAYLWNNLSPFSYKYGMSVNAAFEASAGGTVIFTNGVSISTGALAARRTGPRLPPFNAADNYGASSSIFIETSAGTVAIPTFNQPTRGMSGVSGTPTGWVGTNNFGDTKIIWSSAAP